VAAKLSVIFIEKWKENEWKLLYTDGDYHCKHFIIPTLSDGCISWKWEEIGKKSSLSFCKCDNMYCPIKLWIILIAL
jgi:hypothetical protein